MKLLLKINYKEEVMSIKKIKYYWSLLGFFVLLGCTERIPEPLIEDNNLQIISIRPHNQSFNVPLLSNIEILFNSSLDVKNMNEEMLLLESNNVVVPSDIIVSLGGNAINIRPREPLLPNSDYQIIVGQQVQNLNKSLLGMQRNVQFSTANSSTARYRVTFTSTWSSSTHPADFPSSPHFSGLIGMTHNADTALFDTNSLASPGIKSMAETGAKTTLISEIQAMISKGVAQQIIDGPGVAVSPGVASLQFDIESTHGLVSITSMIAPSPDWFVAIRNIDLHVAGDIWIDNLCIYVNSYDSGTDSGVTFASNNIDTQPRVNISAISNAPLALNGKVVPLGTILFERLQ